MPPPLSQGLVFLAVALAPIVAIGYLGLTGRLPRLEAAFSLFLWGLLIAVVEHAGFGLAEFGGAQLLRHEGFHFQMLAIYGLAAFVLALAMIGPLLRRGERAGWYGLLILTMIGVTGEVLTAMITTPHGVGPRWWSWGLALWAYPLAWGMALVLSRRPIFSPEGG